MAENNKIHDAETSDETMGSKAKEWAEENLRLIVSVIIVLAIAGGIYSYSKRGEENRLALENNTTQEQILLQGEDDSEETIDNVQKEEEATNDSPEEVSSTEVEKSQEESKPTVQPNQETTDGFIVTAQQGDGLTHMARRAVADYLAQNPDSSLTIAHKIYIEDYVRKAVGHKGSVSVGTEVTFSKNVIQDAIGSAKDLSEAQLNNLQKYVALVPSLS
jgi:hypothetical protein